MVLMPQITPLEKLQYLKIVREIVKTVVAAEKLQYLVDLLWTPRHVVVEI
jgi:hypothetical protein